MEALIEVLGTLALHIQHVQAPVVKAIHDNSHNQTYLSDVSGASCHGEQTELTGERAAEDDDEEDEVDEALDDPDRAFETLGRYYTAVT